MQLLSVRVKILNLIRRNNAFKSQHANIRANLNEYYFVVKATLCCFLIKAATFSAPHHKLWKRILWLLRIIKSRHCHTLEHN